MLGTRGGCWSRLLPLHGFAINNFGFSVASLREVRLHRPSWRQGDLITSQRNDSQVLEKGFSGQLKIYISKGFKKGFNNCKFF